MIAFAIIGFIAVAVALVVGVIWLVQHVSVDANNLINQTKPNQEKKD